jgi:hypothetical protein
MSFLELVKKRTSYETRLKIRYKLRSLKALFFMSNLDRLATIHKTDKNRSHFYTQHNQKHFKPFKYKKINLLEIGVGGYEHPLSGVSHYVCGKLSFPSQKFCH